jgi:hypothetical protein
MGIKAGSISNKKSGKTELNLDLSITHYVKIYQTESPFILTISAPQVDNFFSSD